MVFIKQVSEEEPMLRFIVAILVIALVVWLYRRFVKRRAYPPVPSTPPRREPSVHPSRRLLLVVGELDHHPHSYKHGIFTQGPTVPAKPGWDDDLHDYDT